MLRFTPTRARILVEPVQAEPAVGTIIIPEKARETRPSEAVVVALGPRNRLPVRVGDRVLTQRFDGTDVQIGERRYRLLDPENVIAIIGAQPDDAA